MRRLLLATLLFLSACAPKTVPVPTVTTPKFPEFTQPPVPAAFANSPVAATFSRGWAFFQTGDLKTAQREFANALSASPAFYPAETSLGYVELAQKDAKAALPHFDRALETERNDVPALLGRAQSLITLNRESDALAAFEAALAADPSLSDVRRRVEVLRFRSVEQNIARARQLARQGKVDDALEAYTTAIARSPDSPFLYRETAALERQKGNSDAALADFRKAMTLDPTDAKSMAQVGEILDGNGDAEGALKAYSDSLAIEPNADVEKRLENLRERMAIASLPAEYRAIDDAPQITRADLAALIGVRLGPLLQNTDRRRDAVLITDIRTNWASNWIMSVARAGVMEPFANHAFQPRAIVRRTDLATVVYRLLNRIAALHPDQPKTWDTARLRFTDLAPSHLAYAAASGAVAAGILTATPDNAFQPSRPVTGAEAIDAIAKLEAMAGLPAAIRTKTPQ
jgi:tetratricopeptide (TPR) repeat protein